MIPSQMPPGFTRTPQVGEPTGPGIILPWPNHLDARMESIFVRMGTLQQNRFKMSPGERRDLRRALWNDVLIVDEQVTGLADNRGEEEFVKYFTMRDTRYRAATDFQSSARIMMGSFQRWLEQNDLLLNNQHIPRDNVGILLGRMEREEDAARREMREDALEAEEDALAAFDNGLDELGDDGQ